VSFNGLKVCDKMKSSMFNLVRAHFCFLFLTVLSFPALAVELLGPKATQAAVNAGEMILIDIRRPDEWAATGSAKGAVRISMLNKSFTEQVKALQVANPKKRIALICQAGVRSARLSRQLENQGLNGLVDVEGGTQLWIDQGLPVSR
jgi:rhodanese-related sulfurtransferase